MTAERDPPRAVPDVTENVFAPEMFATEALGFFNHQGNIHITFGTPKVLHGQDPVAIKKVVNVRLVIPVLGAQSLAVGLYDFLKKQGLDPIARKPDDPLN